MPTFECRIVVPASRDEIFDYLSRPTNLPDLAPADAQLQVVQGPETLALGSQLTLRAKKLGVAVEMTVEVTDFDPGCRFTLTQQSGQLKSWIHQQSFTDHDEGVEIHDHITFDPPGGMLGFVVTERFIKDDLQTNFAWRDARLQERFGGD